MFKNIFKWSILAEFELICLNKHRRKSPWVTVVGWKLAGLLWTQGPSAWEMALSDECSHLLKQQDKLFPLSLSNSHATQRCPYMSFSQIFWSLCHQGFLKIRGYSIILFSQKISRKTFWGKYFLYQLFKMLLFILTSFIFTFYF